MTELRDGYLALKPGKIAAVVTYLEMRERPEVRQSAWPEGFTIERLARPDLDLYRAAFRAVGEPWLWFSRVVMPDAALTDLLASPAVDVYLLMHEGQPKGMIELDRRGMPDIELVAFGLTPDVVGRGLGRELMNFALRAAWSRSPRRLWLHTCTLDHPKALGFYIHCGFTPYKRGLEIADDPRLSGRLPRTAAPHVPVL